MQFNRTKDGDVAAKCASTQRHCTLTTNSTLKTIPPDDYKTYCGHMDFNDNKPLIIQPLDSGASECLFAPNSKVFLNGKAALGVSGNGKINWE